MFHKQYDSTIKHMRATKIVIYENLSILYIVNTQ